MAKVRQYQKHVGITPGGLSIDIHFTEISQNQQSGPAIYIQSGIHGGELTYWILQELYQFLQDDSDWQGKVTLVGVANPVAWHQRTYFSTNGKFDLYGGKDWNRNFPGRKDGSLGERIAYALFNQAKAADLAIDLHTSRNSPVFNITCDDEGLELAKINGIPFTYHMPLGDQKTIDLYKGTFLLALLNEGVRNVSLECGAHDTYSQENVVKVVEALTIMLAHEGMLKADTSEKPTLVYSKYEVYFAPDGGYVKYHIEPGQKYRKNDLLYSLCNPTDFSEQQVVAKENGICMKLAPTHIMHPGDQVMQGIKA